MIIVESLSKPRGVNFKEKMCKSHRWKFAIFGNFFGETIHQILHRTYHLKAK